MEGSKMSVEAQVILMIIVAAIGVGWLCKSTWDRPTWVAGRGSVITLAGSLVVLLLLAANS